MSQSLHEMGGDALNGLELAPDEQYRLLASGRRRLTLGTLAGTTAPVGLEELAARVAKREGESPTDDAVERVAIALHHVHLPHLSEAGVLSYDSEAHLIEPAGR